jgi:hypothetical protein
MKKNKAKKKRESVRDKKKRESVREKGRRGKAQLTE